MPCGLSGVGTEPKRDAQDMKERLSPVALLRRPMLKKQLSAVQP